MQIIKDYFACGLKYIDIVQILRQRYNIIITERHLKRILNSEHCFKRFQYSCNNDVFNFIDINPRVPVLCMNIDGCTRNA